MIATFDTHEVERFRDLISHTLGLQFDDAKLGFLAEVLRRRLEASDTNPTCTWRRHHGFQPMMWRPLLES